MTAHRPVRGVRGRALALRNPGWLLGLIAVQLVCTVFFVNDVIGDFRAVAGISDAYGHFYAEALATVSLIAAIAFEITYLLQLLRRKQHLEDSLQRAQGAIYDVIEAHFERCGLTPAEHDVATYLVKGLSTPEIAALRGNAEGTIKAHLNAIFRKSGVRNRAEFLSAILDSLMADDGEQVARRSGVGPASEGPADAD